MPLPSDPETLKVSEDLLAQLQAIFGKHPGFRPGKSSRQLNMATSLTHNLAHARGVMTTGTFTPSAAAASLSTAPHFHHPSTPITVRFSSSTGIPAIPDTDPNANPRGVGLRFHLGDRVHTDVIAHSTPFFPAKTGQGFLDFLRAIAASPPGTPSPSPVEKLLGANPAALAFVTAEKPSPASFAKEAFYSVNAFRFIDAEGKGTYFRYRVVPDAGEEHVDAVALKEKTGDYLFDELPKRVAEGKISFTLKAQLAEDGDVVDDCTVHWPESRKMVALGKIELDKMVKESDKEQKHIIYDPLPRCEGVEPSADPLLETRAALYLISGRQRRAA